MGSTYLTKFFKLLKKSSQKGQTAVEYILLFSVVAVMTLAIMKQIKDRVIGDIENCNAGSPSLGCRIKAYFPVGGHQNFRRFPLF